MLEQDNLQGSSLLLQNDTFQVHKRPLKVYGQLIRANFNALTEYFASAQENKSQLYYSNMILCKCIKVHPKSMENKKEPTLI